MVAELDWLAVYNTECGASIALDPDTEIRVWVDPDSGEDLEIIIQAVASGVIAREDRARTNDHTTRAQAEQTAGEIIDDMTDWHRRIGF